MECNTYTKWVRDNVRYMGTKSGGFRLVTTSCPRRLAFVQSACAQIW